MKKLSILFALALCTLAASIAGATGRKISVGEDHACMISQGTAYCWGANNHGQLGVGNTTASLTPLAVTSLGNAVLSIAVSKTGSDTCALVNTQTYAGVYVAQLYCWGDNSHGQVGTGGFVDQLTPYRNTDIPQTLAATDVAIGHDHICAVAPNGSSAAIYCAGDNSHGQLGLGTFGGTATHYAPVYVNTSNAVGTIDAGGNSTCMLSTPGYLYCWGQGDVGQLGVGVVGDQPYETYVWFGGALITAFAEGPTHGCASGKQVSDYTNGSIYCWGANTHGELGDLTTTQRIAPVRVAPSSTGYVSGYYYPLGRGTAFVPGADIDVGTNHSCAHGSDGSGNGTTPYVHLYCWGSEGHGQLGQGVGSDRWNPTLINLTGFFKAPYFSSGGNTTFGGWGGGPQGTGANGFGQIGNGSTADQFTVYPYSPGSLPW